jgi:hypothetical protein
MGISGGARMITHMAAGRSASEGLSHPIGRRSGGNVVPYDPTSGVIFEYVMTRGIPDPPGPFWNVDPELPITAPTVVLIGNADPRQSNAWAYLAKVAGLLESPESLQDWARFYEWQVWSLRRRPARERARATRRGPARARQPVRRTPRW